MTFSRQDLLAVEAIYQRGDWSGLGEQMSDLLVAIGIIAVNGSGAVADGAQVAISADGCSVMVEFCNKRIFLSLMNRRAVVVQSLLGLSELKQWNVWRASELVNLLGASGRLLDQCSMTDCKVDGSVGRCVLQLIRSVSDLAKRMEFVSLLKIETLNCWLTVKCHRHVNLLIGFLYTTRSDWSFLLRHEAFHHVLSTILNAMRSLTDRDASVIGRLLRVQFVESNRQHCLLIGDLLPGILSDDVLLALLVDLHRKFAYSVEESVWYWQLIERNVNKRQVFYLLDRSQIASSMPQRFQLMKRHVQLDLKMQPLLVKALLRVIPFVSDAWMAHLLMEVMVDWHVDYVPIVRSIIYRMEKLEDMEDWRMLLPIAIERFLENLQYCSVESIRLVELIQTSVYKRSPETPLDLRSVDGCRYVHMECNRLLHGAFGLTSVRSFCELVSWSRLFQSNPQVEEEIEYCKEHLQCRVSKDHCIADSIESENGQILQALAHVEPFDFVNACNFGAVLLFECTLCKGQFNLERRLLLDFAASVIPVDLSIIVDEHANLKDRLMHAAALETQFGHQLPGSAHFSAEPFVIDSVMTRHAQSLGANSLDVWQAISKASSHRWRRFIYLIYGLEQSFGVVGLEDILDLCTDPSAIMLFGLHRDCFMSLGRKLMGNMINVVYNHGSKLPFLHWLLVRMLDDSIE